MSITSALFEDSSSLKLTECLRAMRLVLLRFSEIHSPFITKQIPNTYETYLPISLVCNDGSLMNVNDIFVSNIPSVEEESNLAPSETQACVVYGSHGSGKTALVTYLKYQWLLEADDVKGIEDFKMVVFIDAKLPFLGSRKPSAKSILRYLSQRMSVDYIPSSMSQEEILSGLSNIKLLWLVDGFQSAPEENREAIAWVLRVLKNSKVLITSHFSHTSTIRSLMANAGATYCPLVIRPLTFETWKLMVPKMMAAKIRNPVLIKEASDEYISAFAEVPQLLLPDLATAVNDWMEIRYPYLLRADRDIYRNCIDNYVL